MQRIEILAPAGSPEHLIPALRCGADAVYLGLKSMNARVSAGNFSLEQLRDAVFECHARDVKVYLTLNTLIKSREMESALEAAEMACKAGVDALIVQDIGLAGLLHDAMPEMPLHASTQMSVHTPGGAVMLYEKGFRRVVLARECSEAEIRDIHEACPIELEVFIHGALCMSVSGQCYLSAMLGGRSGNRGQCAQPCRLPFSDGNVEYALSLRDNSIIDRLPLLNEMGVTSAKIEGRMKRPEYVAAAVSACRQMMDNGRIDEDLRNKLEAVFSRSGFTSGYFDGERGRNMFGIRAYEDVTAASGELLSELRQTYKDEPGRIAVGFDLYAKPGCPVKLTAREENGTQVILEGVNAEKAVNRPMQEERCRSQLCRTGGTPFFTSHDKINVMLEGEPAFPVSEINRLRREGLDKLLCMRAEWPEKIYHAPNIDIISGAWPLRTSRRADRIPIRAHFRTAVLPERALECELCYVPLFTPPELMRKLISNGFKIGVELPRGLFSLEDKARQALDGAYSAGVRDAYTSNLGGIPLVKEAGMRLHGGLGLNIMNGFSLNELLKLGAADAELSIELSQSEVETMPKPLPVGAVVYGHLPLMLMRCCPAKVSDGICAKCRGNGKLKDRKGMLFPVSCEGSCTELFNPMPLEMSDRLAEIMGLQYISMRFTVENTVESEEKLAQYIERKRPVPGYTRGLWARSVR